MSTALYRPIRAQPQKFRRCIKKERGKQRPCFRVYLRRESSNRIKHAIVQRQCLNQVQAKSNRASTECSAGYHLSHLESCCYFHLRGQFSPAAKVVFEATTAIEIKGVAMASRAGCVGGKQGRIRYIRLPENKVEFFPHASFQIWLARWTVLLPVDSNRVMDSITTSGLSEYGLHILSREESMSIFLWKLTSTVHRHALWLINHDQQYVNKDSDLPWCGLSEWALP